jgi:hypothetical protein
VTADFPAAIRDLVAAMAEIGRPWMVIGGIAVVAHGVPRATIDLDATVAAAGTDPEWALEVLERHGFAARIAGAGPFARQHQVLLVAHQASGVPVDLTLAWLPFEEQALSRARAMPFPGVDVPVVALDDLLVYKLVASRPRDIEDVERLFATHRDSVDAEHVSRLVAEFCGFLDDTSRTNTWDRIRNTD